MSGKNFLLCLVAIQIPSASAHSQIVPVPFEKVVPGGVVCDSQTSVMYDPNTGEVAIDAPIGELFEYVYLSSETSLFIPEQAENIGFGLDTVRTNELIKNSHGNDFGSFSLGRVMPSGLTQEFILGDIIATGSRHDDRPIHVALLDPLFLGPVDLIVGPIKGLGSCGDPNVLHAGDADQDFDFDQLDLVKVQVAAKFLTGEPASWGEGDWDGAPGGRAGDPPPGDGLFDQRDIVAALAGAEYLSGPYAALQPFGLIHEEPVETLANDYDQGANHGVFQATLTDNIGSLGFGGLAQAGFPEQQTTIDQSVVGTSSSGDDLGEVHMTTIPIPEPGTAFLICIGSLVLSFVRIRRRRT